MFQEFKRKQEIESHSHDAFRLGPTPIIIRYDLQTITTQIIKILSRSEAVDEQKRTNNQFSHKSEDI